MASEAQELLLTVDDLEWTRLGEDGPLAMFGPDGNIAGGTDATLMKALAEA